jgi:glycosyltransferase involved in cell wall biosynthesis
MLLSICMPTLNRASYIGATLDSLLPQLGDDMEVVIVDGGSRDNTAEVVKARSSACARIRYHLTPHLAAGLPKPSNVGYDRDCDHAVQLARGRYCWLLPDDDLLVPDALSRLRPYLQSGVALIIANAEARSMDLSKRLEARRMKIHGDVTFARGEADLVMSVAGKYLSYAGGVVVRRDWWLTKDRAKYYGTGFVHVGTIFQAPSDLDAIAIAKPLILLRYGNALWSDRAFAIWMYHWPELIWSLPLGDKAKKGVTPREPWRKVHFLTLFRAKECYGWREYRSLVERKALRWQERVTPALIAATPAWILNAIALLGVLVLGKRQSVHFFDLWESRYNALSRVKRRNQDS